MDKLHQALRRYFGYHAFKKGQETIIKSVLEGRDTVAMLPTGGGKSLCYQAPRAFVRRHRPDRLAAFVFNGRPGAAIEDARREESLPP